MAHKKGPMDVKIGEGLEIGSVHPAHKKGIVNGLGNHQAKETSPTGASNHETLRSGRKPSSEGVRNTAPADTKTTSKARMFNDRSQNGGAEKGGGW